MSLIVERLRNTVKEQGEAIKEQGKVIKELSETTKELQLVMNKQTSLVLQLLDEKTGLEAVFQAKVNQMVDENLELVFEYEQDSLRLKEYLENEVEPHEPV